MIKKGQSNKRGFVMLISQTYRGSPELKQEGYRLLQKWYRLTNEKKHEIIKTVLADGLNNNNITGQTIKRDLADAINKAVPDAALNNLNY
jgi:hypothetical protein